MKSNNLANPNLGDLIQILGHTSQKIIKFHMNKLKSALRSLGYLINLINGILCFYKSNKYLIKSHFSQYVC